jgi:regulator of sigma E protease
MTLLHTLVSFLAAIIILVAVHEFGHFYIARRCGVQVLRFSLGFGKVLWSRYDRLGTEYTFSALPFGGYVKMLDEREGDVPNDLLDRAFNRKTILQRMAIVLAGPIANFILAILLFWFLLLGGERGLVPIIGTLTPDSLAAKAGLEIGQEIVAIDGQETPTEQAVQKQLLERLGESGFVNFKVRYPKSNLEYDIRIPLDKWMQGAKDPNPLEGLGIEIFYPLAAIAGDIQAGSASEKSGFKTGDKILSVDGQQVRDWRDWVNYVRARPGKLLNVEIERGGLDQYSNSAQQNPANPKNESGQDLVATNDLNKTQSTNIQVARISLQVTPESFLEKGVSYGRVGMGLHPQEPPSDLLRLQTYSFGSALVASVKKTWETARFVLLSVKKLILGEISTKNLSGPISIAKVAASSAHQGLKSFIGFVALLSVFLGVFNLLPVPVLDGGHLIYLAAEAIRGKPLSERIQVMASQLGFLLVIGLSIVAVYNDILRL